MQEVAKKVNNTRIALLRGDITRQEVDAIVNAANSSLLGGGGVDGAIHRAGEGILAQCKEIRNTSGQCPPGQAVITGGGKLPAKFVIHAVGPVWHGGNSNEPAVLASAYKESLTRALEAGVKSVAFPSISTGAYGYPVDKAASVALSQVKSFCEDCRQFDEVRFVLFDERTFAAYKEALESLV